MARSNPQSKAIISIVLMALMMSGAFAAPASEILGDMSPSTPPDAARTKFDFGTGTSAVEAGWVGVTPRDTYTAGNGYGWNQTLEGAAQADQDGLDWFVSQEDDMLIDCNFMNSSSSFRIDVANGQWRVIVYIGEVRSATIRGGGAHLNQTFYINDVLVADNVTTRQFDHRSISPPINETTDHGGYRTFRETVDVTRGVIFVNFSATMDNRSFVMGIEAHLASSLPLTGSGGQLALDPGMTDSDLQDAVASYNAGDLDQALIYFLQVEEGVNGTQDLAKALGLLWAIGTPAMLDHVPDVLPKANGLIQNYCENNSTDMAAYEMCLVSHWMNTTVKHFDLRGYGGGDTLLKNVYHAEMLANNILPTDPTYDLARFYRMRVFHGCDPRRTTYQTTWGDELANALYPDYDDVVEVVYHHIFANYGENNTGDFDALYSQYEALRYWETDYDTGNANAPEWASKQREAIKRLVEIMEWWGDNRQAENGELGGGWSDDVELTRSWRGALIGLGGVSPDAVDAVTLMADGVWYSGAIENGYQALISDVEHSGEMSADGESWLPGILYGDPLYIERNMETHLQIHNNFSGIDNNDRRHFQSYYYGANGVSPNPTFAFDVPLNARAASSTFWNHWYNGGNMEDDFVDQWTEAWYEECMSTNEGKPEGFVPPGVAYPSGFYSVGGNDWYDFNGDNAYVWPATTYHSRIIYELLVDQWIRTGDEKYLEPLFIVAEAAKRYTGPANPPVGSPDWFNKSAKDTGVFETLQRWRWITGNTTFDPIFDKLWRPETNYTKFLMTQDKDHLIKYMDQTINWLTYFRPFMTSENIMTDRAYILGQTNALVNHMLLGGMGLITPGMTVTWDNTSRDFAGLVTYPGTDRVNAVAYNFQPDPREIEIRLWSVPPGTYDISLGPDNDEDDEPDTYLHTEEKELTHRGDGFKFTIPAQQLIAINITQVSTTGGQPAALADLGAMERDMDVTQYSNGYGVELKVHNIGNNMAQGFNVTFYQVEEDGTTHELGNVTNLVLQAPTDCKNKVRVVNLNGIHPYGTGNFTIRAVIDEDDVVPEITEVNNKVDISIERQIDIVPDLIAPLNGTWTNSTPTLMLSHGAQAIVPFRIQVAVQGTNFTNPIVDMTSLPTDANWSSDYYGYQQEAQFITPLALGNGMDYSWRAQVPGHEWSEVWNLTADSDRPHVQALVPEFNKGINCQITWNITDNTSGPSLSPPDVYYKMDSWTGYQKLNVIGGSAYFDGLDGRTYHVLVEAMDQVGNIANDTATTLLDATPPTSLMDPTGNFTSDPEVPVSWSGNDTINGSGIASYNIYVSENRGLTWVLWLNQTTDTNATYTGLPGVEYSFRCEAIDRAGNIEGQSTGATPGIKIDTTVPIGNVSGSIPDTGTIDAGLRFSDPESGIQYIEYKIGTADGLEDVVPANVTGLVSIRVTGLNLTEGRDYHITARATNWANLTSEWVSSGPIMAPPGTSGLTLVYPDQVLITETISIDMASDIAVTDWDLEVNSSPYYDGSTNDWSGWLEVGGTDGGDGSVTSFVGERGRVYAFRLRVRFAGSDWSPYLEPTFRTRLNRAPDGAISVETKDPTAGKKVSFEAHVGDDDADGMTYTWDFGDGKEDAEPQGTIASHVFGKAGTYTVTLSITDGHEWTNVTVEVTVKKAGPGTGGLGGNLLWLLLAVIMVVVVILVLLFFKRKEGTDEVDPGPVEGPAVELDDEEKALLEGEDIDTDEGPEEDPDDDPEEDDLDTLVEEVQEEVEEESHSDIRTEVEKGSDELKKAIDDSVKDVGKDL